ncbi:MAG: alpha/beta fold hydrolase [Bacteroidia bacterium]|nr:alpha/beta fold hydrolase [Bacteroidia bacterium]MBP6649927.1 alpha/beta fold hydrolase [Bacteroidia bacterium]
MNILKKSDPKIIRGLNLSIEMQDITISYNDVGEGSTPIIFLHGFPFDKSSWQPQISYFQKTNRVIAYDIRGFGKSTSGNIKESISLFADDLIYFMDGLKIEKAIVCGLSMGGYILLNAMARFPERFEALILSDTQCLSDSPEMKEKRNQSIKKINENGYPEFAENFVKAVFCAETIKTKLEVVEKIKHVILSTSPKTVIGTLNALAQRWEMCTSLINIAVPVLIICGTEDKVTPLAQSEYLHDNIANSTLHSIANAGHMSNLEQPEEFNRHVEDFISAISN